MAPAHHEESRFQAVPKPEAPKEQQSLRSVLSDIRRHSQLDEAKRQSEGWSDGA